MPLPFLAALAVAAAPAIIGGAVSAMGQHSANEENKRATREEMAFSERMSNTQYQRGVADMKKAGINPMLAYKQGGASSPSGSSYTAQNVGSAAVQGASSAQSVNRSLREQDLVKDQMGANIDLTNQQAINAHQSRDLIRAQIVSAKAQAAHSSASALREAAQTSVLGQTLHSAKSAAAIAKTDEALANSPGGKFLRVVNRVGTSLNPFVDAGTSIANSNAKYPK